MKMSLGCEIVVPVNELEMDSGDLTSESRLLPGSLVRHGIGLPAYTPDISSQRTRTRGNGKDSSNQILRSDYIGSIWKTLNV